MNGNNKHVTAQLAVIIVVGTILGACAAAHLLQWLVQNGG